MVPRRQPEPYSPVVQHGGVRQPRQSGYAPCQETIESLGGEAEWLKISGLSFDRDEAFQFFVEVLDEHEVRRRRLGDAVVEVDEALSVGCHVEVRVE